MKIVADLLEKAAQALGSARLLADVRDTNGSCNRSYYAMHQAAKAALITSGLAPDSFKTHSFTIAEFGRRFVLTGLISKDIGKAINEVEKMRAIADYAATDLPIEKAVWAVEQAERFVSAVKALHIAGDATGKRVTAKPPTTVLRASLRPRLYREIEILSGDSLHELAVAITQAFEFNFDHAFGFYDKLTGNYGRLSSRKYELFADMGQAEPGVMGVETIPVCDAFPNVGTKMLFVFDYGFEWRFTVEVIGLGEKVPRARYPKVVKKVGKAPEQYPDEDDLYEDEDN